MKALFSRRNKQSEGFASSSSNTLHSNNEKDSREKRIISSTSIFEKRGNGPVFANNYVEAQDVLYPSSAIQSTQAHHRFGNRQDNGMASVRGRPPPLSLSGKADVGDAPTSPTSSKPALARRSSKMLFNSLRGRKLSSPSAWVGDAGSNTKNNLHSSTPSPNAKASERIEAPLFVLSARSLSMPAPDRDIDKTKKFQPPSVPEKIISIDGKNNPDPQLSPQSAARTAKATQSDNTRITNNGMGPDATSKQKGITTFSSSSRLQLPFLNNAPEDSMSKSLPATPQMDQENGFHPASSSTKDDESFVLKRAFTRRNGSKADERDERRTREANDALSLKSHQSTSPRQVLSAARPPPTRNQSQDLASELNELAVAFKEGLLGEEEYRMLRQNVFDKMKSRGEMEMPREGRIQGITVEKNGDTTATEDNLSLLSPAPSLRSKFSSTMKRSSLFKKGIRSEATLSTNQGFRSSSSLFSGTESMISGTAPSMQSRVSSSMALDSHILKARRARMTQSSASQQGVEGWSSSSSIAQRGAPISRSRIGSSLHSASGISASGMSISSGNALLGMSYSEKTSNEIQAEIAVVEAEGKRILEGFKSLQMNAMARYNLDFVMLKQALQGVGLDPEIESDFFGGFVVVDADDVGGSKCGQGLYTQGNGSGELISGFSRKSRTLSAKDSLTNNNGRRVKKKGDLTVPPSSYRGSLGPSSSPSSPSLSSNAANSKAHNGEEDAEVVNLRAELKEIIRRRDEVGKKYADRLAFLSSTLRSAKIREGL